VTSTARLPRSAAALRKAALADAETFSLSAKLPSSRDVALKLPFASPTHYGLGKSGWVTATFPRKSNVPLDLLKLWIDESYRAVAPKRLVAGLGDRLGT
jgi:hypothetical protein